MEDEVHHSEPIPISSPKIGRLKDAEGSSFTDLSELAGLISETEEESVNSDDSSSLSSMAHEETGEEEEDYGDWFLTPEEKEEFRSEFQREDRDQDGFITGMHLLYTTIFPSL